MQQILASAVAPAVTSMVPSVVEAVVTAVVTALAVLLVSTSPALAASQSCGNLLTSAPASSYSSAEIHEFLQTHSVPMRGFAFHWGTKERVTRAYNRPLDYGRFRALVPPQGVSDSSPIYGSGLYFSTSMVKYKGWTNGGSEAASFMVLDFTRSNSRILVALSAETGLPLGELDRAESAMANVIFRQLEQSGSVGEGDMHTSLYSASVYHNSSQADVGIVYQPSATVQLLSPRMFVKRLIEDPRLLIDVDVKNLVVALVTIGADDLSSQLLEFITNRGLEWVFDSEQTRIPGHAPDVPITALSRPESLQHLVPNVLALRLIDPIHWTQAADQTAPFLAYGSHAALAWNRAYTYMFNQTARLPTLNDLKDLNKICYTFEGATFWSYFQHLAGKLENERARREAMRTLTHKKVPSGFFADGVQGQWRDGQIYISSAKPFSPSVMAYVTTVRQGQNAATLRYPAPEEISIYLDMLWTDLHAAEQAMTRLSRFSDRVEHGYLAAAKLYQGLVAVHPFWDGNGRTAKLIRDWVLFHWGLNPPLFTGPEDFEQTPENLGRQMRTNAGADIKIKAYRQLGID